ncbi:heat-shock protein Hsp20 [Mycobacterium sp. ACS4331]|nr:heat-shock protein Hsp20 [Mycobacterium sp. ACS4331]
MSNVALWARPSWPADRWAHDLFGPAAFADWIKPLNLEQAAFNPAAEVIKDGDDAVVRLELPGVDVAKDVNVDVENGHLVIHGERRDEFAEEKDGRTLREVRYGSFRRAFALPEHVTGDAVTASYEAGVLTVRVAGAHRKPEIPGAQRISIESKQPPTKTAVGAIPDGSSRSPQSRRFSLSPSGTGSPSSARTARPGGTDRN